MWTAASARPPAWVPITTRPDRCGRHLRKSALTVWSGRFFDGLAKTGAMVAPGRTQKLLENGEWCWVWIMSSMVNGGVAWLGSPSATQSA